MKKSRGSETSVLIADNGAVAAATANKWHQLKGLGTENVKGNLSGLISVESYGL